jgi:hypothetical protein
LAAAGECVGRTEELMEKFSTYLEAEILQIIAKVRNLSFDLPETAGHFL